MDGPTRPRWFSQVQGGAPEHARARISLQPGHLPTPPGSSQVGGIPGLRRYAIERRGSADVSRSHEHDGTAGVDL